MALGRTNLNDAVDSGAVLRTTHQPDDRVTRYFASIRLPSLS